MWEQLRGEGPTVPRKRRTEALLGAEVQVGEDDPPGKLERVKVVLVRVVDLEGTASRPDQLPQGVVQHGRHAVHHDRRGERSRGICGDELEHVDGFLSQDVPVARHCSGLCQLPLVLWGGRGEREGESNGGWG